MDDPTVDDPRVDDPVVDDPVVDDPVVRSAPASDTPPTTGGGSADAPAVHDRFAARIEEVTAREASRARHPAGGAPTLRIDCADCAVRCTAACDDCVVSFIVNRDPGDALVVDVAEARAVRLLTDAGLLPGLRHERRAAGD